MRTDYWPHCHGIVLALAVSAGMTASRAQELGMESSRAFQWGPDPAPTLAEALPEIGDNRRGEGPVAVLGRMQNGSEAASPNNRSRSIPRARSRQTRTPEYPEGRPRSSGRTERPVRIPPWRGTLLPNPDQGNGHPPYIVVDHYEMKRRYIRPARGINLRGHLYQPVIVRQDTGLILSARQLDFSASEFDATERSVDDTRPQDWDPGYDAWEYGDDRFDGGGSGRTRIDSQNDRTDVHHAQYFEELPPGGSVEPPPVELLPSDGEPLILDDWEEEYVMDPGDADPYSRRSGPLGLGLLERGRGMLSHQHGNDDLGLFSQDGLWTGRNEDPCTSEYGECTELPRIWGHGEYLLWWTSGMYLPPLVTTSPAGTDRSAAGVLGQAGTTIVYGNGILMDGDRDGARFGAGFRLLPRLGAEMDYFGLEDEWIRYQAAGVAGSPILGRPFFNMLTAAEDAELVSFPGLVEGTVTVDTDSDLESYGIGGRYGLCCKTIDCGNFAPIRLMRIDLLGGYRYMQLDEGLRIREDLTSLDQENPGNFILQDSFRTHNDFHGGEVGAVWLWERPWWSIELLAKIAIGSTRQEVTIAGNTVVTDGGFSQSSTGGLLAQRSNIGRHVRKEFSMIPQLGATLGLRVTKQLRLTAGYSLIYWSRVVQPGHQVDFDLNPNLFPPEVVPLDGPLRPAFAWNDTDFWAQGLHAGLDFRW